MCLRVLVLLVYLMADQDALLLEGLQCGSTLSRNWLRSMGS
jgi:hypothetical protein